MFSGKLPSPRIISAIELSSVIEPTVIVGFPVEQHRIVAKVDELMALCDALEAGTFEGIEAMKWLVENLLATLTNSQNAQDLAESWARIEVHFDTLFTTEGSIDQLKQTILQLAVMAARRARPERRTCIGVVAADWQGDCRLLESRGHTSNAGRADWS